MAKLIAQSGHSLDLPRRKVSFGESVSCDIPLATGVGLAPLHFEIEPDGSGNYVLRDVSDGLGVVVNGVAVAECVLEHGDVVSAGGLRLGFWATDAQARNQAPFLAGSVTTVPVSMMENLNAPDPISGLQNKAAAETGSKSPSTVPSSIIPAIKAVESIPLFIPSEFAPAVPPPLASAQIRAVTSASPSAVNVPPPIPIHSAPNLINGSTEGSPPAWVSAENCNAPTPTTPPPASPEVPRTQHNSPTDGSPSAPAAKVKKPWRKTGKRKRLSIVKPVIFAVVAVSLAAGGTIASKNPRVRNIVMPALAKFQKWTKPEVPLPGTSSAKVSANNKARKATAAPALPATITPQSEHGNVVKRFLTERTTQLFYADLRQLIPYYNANAGAKNLPPRREMAQAFQKNYGISFDGFEEVTCMRGQGADEFVFVFSSATQISLESLLGIPADRVQPQQPAAASKSSASGNTNSAPVHRIHQIKTPGRSYGAALYDPFTLVLGKHAWIDGVLNKETGPSLREASCMFPETAHRAPGALIIVERVPIIKETDAKTVFETITSNIFLADKGISRLTLARNPEVKESVFVEHSGNALREQMDILTKASRAGHLSRATAKKQSQAAVPDPVLEEGQTISINEASIIIPDGELLIQDAMESMARAFMSRSPAIELILAAQRAVVNFNQARYIQAEDALKAEGVAAALELLQSGISGTGNMSSRTYKIDPLEPAQMEEMLKLLTLDPKTGLIFRPDATQIKGAMLELSIKARDYRNAELLISLWKESNLGAPTSLSTNDAIKQVLTWAKGDGRQKRSQLGLPTLTNEEITGAAAMLGLTEGRLTWRPGEEGYRKWLNKMNPDPKNDAKRIASNFNSARRDGKITTRKITELTQAISAVTGFSSSKSGVGSYSGAQINAASRFLRFQDGTLVVVDN